jgi:hypothetical protein
MDWRGNASAPGIYRCADLWNCFAVVSGPVIVGADQKWNEGKSRGEWRKVNGNQKK